ncbi:MAG TPA: hypothetical protein VF896_09920 [Anaerolineales bacterium]
MKVTEYRRVRSYLESALLPLTLPYVFPASLVWIRLQSQYDLEIAEDQLGKRLEREVHHYAMAQ